MGFDYVAPKPVAIDIIKRQVNKDIITKNLKPGKINKIQKNDTHFALLLEDVNDDALADQEFLSLKEEVLSSWPTGSGVQYDTEKSLKSD